MRSIKPVSLLIAAAAVLALAPAGASARPGHAKRVSAKRPCSVHIETPRTPVASGEPLTIYGTLRCAHSERPAGRQVTVYKQSAGSSGFTAIGTATTVTGGAFLLPPLTLATNSTFYALSEGARSSHRTIRVQAPITLTTPPTPPEGAQLLASAGSTQKAEKFAGVVSKADAGAGVTLQRESTTTNEGWRSIAHGRVNPSGQFMIEHVFTVPGDANLRVIVHASHVNAAAATSPVSYEISQAQNPALTIESTLDPLIYGQSVVIKGAVAGAAQNTLVTLLSSGSAGTFAPVAFAHVGQGGSYQFASQTPLANTFYEVKTATAQSTILFEGVRYALTVAPTPSTVQAGQPLEISGSVLPALTGHVVYLERQGSLKLGGSWHVVDVGVLGKPASSKEGAPFKIVHTFYAPSKARLRIKIPGDPAGQANVLAPFEVTVTPSPASALRPESPNNSKLPSEGQL